MQYQLAWCAIISTAVGGRRMKIMEEVQVSYHSTLPAIPLFIPPFLFFPPFVSLAFEDRSRQHPRRRAPLLFLDHTFRYIRVLISIGNYESHLHFHLSSLWISCRLF